MARFNLISALFPKNRQAVLGLLHGQPGKTYYLRQVVEKTGLGVGHVQRELNRLAEAGIIRRFKRGRHVFFQANENCPIYGELRQIVMKTIGVHDVLAAALEPLRELIRVAFVFGSVARVTERSDSDLDLMVIGDVTFAQVAAAIRDSELEIGRAINPVVYPRDEFMRKLSEGHHFLTSVCKDDKLLVIGDDDDLAALSGQSLDSRP